MFTARFAVVTASDPTPPHDDPSEGPQPFDHPSSDAAPRRVWRSDELFGDGNEALIMHGEMVYRLRRTRNGKLILHK